MRSLVALVLVLAAACGGRTKGPAWPEMAAREEDGGESLAPRQPSVVAEASKDKVKDDDETKPAAAAEPAATKPVDETNADASEPTLGPAVVAPEEIINLDDIVIEVED